MTATAVRGTRPLPAVTGRVLAVASLGVVLAAGVAVALAGAAGDDGFLVPALVRARASWIPGPLAGLAISTPLDTVFWELAVMGAAYAAVVALAPQLRLRWVLAGAVALHAVFLLAPPLFSTDVFNYTDVGQLAARYHLDPYSHPPIAARHDGLFVFLHWRHAVTVYGPIFTLAARLFGRMSVSDAIWGFKAIAAVSSLGCTGLIAWIARRRGHSPARAAAAFGLNPVVLVWTVGGAHNDLLMVLLLLAGVALLTASRPVWSGAAVVGAAAIKLSAGLAIPFLVVGARGQRLRVLAGAVGATAAAVALAYVAFPDHAVGMITGLQHQQSLDSIASVPTETTYVFGLSTVPALAFHVLLALWLGTCAMAVLRGGDPVALAGWALLGVVVASTWLLPWYLVWPLALAAAAGDRRLLIATCAVALSYAVGHVPLT